MRTATSDKRLRVRALLYAAVGIWIAPQTALHMYCVSSSKVEPSPPVPTANIHSLHKHTAVSYALVLNITNMCNCHSNERQ
eukprot:1315-Heterococcus_DN1.PRE.2